MNLANSPNRLTPVELYFPFTTILTVIATLAVIKLLAICSPLALPLIIAAMLAVALTPLERRLTARGFRRSLVIFFITTTLCLLIAAFLAFIMPKIYAQATEFYNSLPKLRQDLLARVGPGSPLKPMLEHGLHRDLVFGKNADIKQILGAGNYVLGGFTEIILIFVLTIYLLIDGPRLIEWLKAFFAPSTQQKIKETGHEVSKIVSAYVGGQVITSVLSFIFVFLGLRILGVPNVLLLATLSGVLDVLPVLGFVIAVIPAMFFALEISPSTSLLVLALYLIYHGIENYLIVPVVYGKSLRISSFVVFFSLLVAGLAAGIEGAIAVLPIIASYPVIERLWLRPYLRPQTLAAHAAEANA